MCAMCATLSLFLSLYYSRLTVNTMSRDYSHVTTVSVCSTPLVSLSLSSAQVVCYKTRIVLTAY